MWGVGPEATKREEGWDPALGKHRDSVAPCWRSPFKPVIEHVDQTTLNALQLVLQKSICSSAITSRSLQPALTLAAHLGGSLKHKICPMVSEWVSEGPVEETYRSAGWVNRINHQSWCCFSCCCISFVSYLDAPHRWISAGTHVGCQWQRGH